MEDVNETVADVVIKQVASGFDKLSELNDEELVAEIEQIDEKETELTQVIVDVTKAKADTVVEKSVRNSPVQALKDIADTY